jgi:hypothetical protein
MSKIHCHVSQPMNLDFNTEHSRMPQRLSLLNEWCSTPPSDAQYQSCEFGVTRLTQGCCQVCILSPQCPAGFSIQEAPTCTCQVFTHDVILNFNAEPSTFPSHPENLDSLIGGIHFMGQCPVQGIIVPSGYCVHIFVLMPPGCRLGHWPAGTASQES